MSQIQQHLLKDNSNIPHEYAKKFPNAYSDGHQAYQIENDNDFNCFLNKGKEDYEMKQFSLQPSSMNNFQKLQYVQAPINSMPNGFIKPSTPQNVDNFTFNAGFSTEGSMNQYQLDYQNSNIQTDELFHEPKLTIEEIINDQSQNFFFLTTPSPFTDAFDMTRPLADNNYFSDLQHQPTQQDQRLNQYAANGGGYQEQYQADDIQYQPFDISSSQGENQDEGDDFTHKNEASQIPQPWMTMNSVEEIKEEQFQQSLPQEGQQESSDTADSTNLEKVSNQINISEQDSSDLTTQQQPQRTKKGRPSFGDTKIKAVERFILEKRAIFRALKRAFDKNENFKVLLRNIIMENSQEESLFEMASPYFENSHALYNNYGNNRAANQRANDLPIMQRVCYRFTKESKELFFSNDVLAMVFQKAVPFLQKDTKFEGKEEHYSSIIAELLSVRDQVKQ